MKKQEKNSNRLMNVIIPFILLGAIIAAVFIGTIWSREQTKARMQQSLHMMAYNQAMALNDQIENKYSLLQGLASAFDQNDIKNQQHMQTKLTDFAKQSDFISIYFAYPDGKGFRHDGKAVDLSDRWYFSECLGGVRALERLEQGKLDDEVRFCVAVPIILKNRVAGVLVGDYNESGFRNIFETTNENTSDFSYVCNSQGEIIIASDLANYFLNENLPDLERSVIFDILEQSEFTEGTLAQFQASMEIGRGGEFAYQYQGENNYAMYEPVKLNDWFVVSVRPGEEFRAQVFSDAWILYAMLMVVMVATIAIVLFILFRERKLEQRAVREAEMLRFIMEHDDLTGLLVEKVFYTKAKEQLQYAKPGEYCLLYFDIDKFKLINEMFGYQKGDALLCAIAAQMKEIEYEYQGMGCRISGDKFVLLLPNQEELLELLVKLRKQQKRLVPMELFVHFGVYQIMNPQMPVAAMVDCAQLAQKTIKGEYDNYIAYYDEKLKNQIIREQEINSSMVQALENDEFQIYLQPQFNYRNGMINGAEALVRWISPNKGMISPAEFIPVFETNGFITRLDENVWEQACALMRKWLDEGKEPLPISVNVSRVDLYRGSVAQKLYALIEKYRLRPELLRVEITESAYMDNPQQLILAINELRNYGFVVEMDDFGSGYSSLNMLKDVPINVLKTDLKFLDTPGIDERRNMILDHIIQMAHQIGLEVVAEGVETKEQAEYLARLNCEVMQGYYFSKPIPVSDFEEIVYKNE